MSELAAIVGFFYLFIGIYLYRKGLITGYNRGHEDAMHKWQEYTDEKLKLEKEPHNN